MQIFIDGASDITENTAVALGQFDAMHIGHTAIIQKAVEYAKENDIKSLVFMFENDPAEVILGRPPKAVNSLSQRLDVLRSLGVDIVVVKRFDEEFSRLGAVEFVNEYLRGRLGAVYVSVGFNYRFGKNAEGDTRLLDSECSRLGIELCVVPEVRLDGEIVSSSLIRSAVISGDMEKAARLMGRCYKTGGTVVEGNRLGGTVLGFPTANINMPSGRVIPKFGVYIARAMLDGAEYPAICNIGEKPTVENNYTCIETHILGSFGELYGKNIEIEICKFIRETTRFDGMEALSEQLRADRCEAESYFGL